MSGQRADQFRIEGAGPDDLADVAGLFSAYAASLPVDLGYQDFAAELAGLPGRYAPPDGALLIARNGEALAIGCAALRRLAPGIAEMKRLYVAPAGRGQGLGRALALGIVAQARDLGYRAIRLDTLASMTPALGLYRGLGFVEIGPYYATPVPDTVFLEKTL